MKKLQTIRILAAALLLCLPIWAQFNSGSNGTDGALNLTTPGTVILDPVALNLDADGDNVYHFTTVNIGEGVTVVLRQDKMRIAGAVVWLASGNVTIAGTLDLSGENGHDGGPAAVRKASAPGPGGWAGGVGGRLGSAAGIGLGPGGGRVNGCGASHATPPPNCNTPPAYGNILLVPLRGGSGGMGGGVLNNIPGAGGGAGGGALRIASSGIIGVTGTVRTNGGASGNANGGGRSGSGSGGGLHLQSTQLTGNGSVLALGGIDPSPVFDFNKLSGAAGRIRVDVATNNFTGTINPAPTFGAPYNTPLPMSPTVRIISVNGVAVPATPQGSFTAPDVTINSATAVNVAISARNVPIGTVVRLILSSETGTDQTIDCAPLAGSVTNATATCSATFPLGISATLARATW